MKSASYVKRYLRNLYGAPDCSIVLISHWPYGPAERIPWCPKGTGGDFLKDFQMPSAFPLRRFSGEGCPILLVKSDGGRSHRGGDDGALNLRDVGAPAPHVVKGKLLRHRGRRRKAFGGETYQHTLTFAARINIVLRLCCTSAAVCETVLCNIRRIHTMPL